MGEAEGEGESRGEGEGLNHLKGKKNIENRVAKRFFHMGLLIGMSMKTDPFSQMDLFKRSTGENGFSHMGYY